MMIILVNKIYYAPTDDMAVPPFIEEKLIDRVLPTNVGVDMEVEKKIDTENMPVFTERLIIPALKINAKIQNVGITKKGNMSTPTNFFDVGLYKYGTPPGEIGSAVIAGHVENGLGLKAVFGNLKNIKEGDDIYIEKELGEKIHFVVTSTAIYDYNSSAEEVFNQNDGAYLKIITCTGKWMPDLRTHDKRLIVTAIKAET